MIYGIDIGSLEFTNETYEKFLKLFKSTPVRLPGIETTTTDFKNYKSKQTEQITNKQTELEAFKSYLKMLDFDGISKAHVITEIINKRENLTLAVNDSVIGCPYMTPWETPDNMKDLTENIFIYTLNQYINYLWSNEKDTLNHIMDYETYEIIS